MIIVLGGIKGGSGKTTLATNLTVLRASEGRHVLLVDADEQCSASDWAEHRDGLGIPTPWTTIRLAGSAVRTQVQKMAASYDDIIIDTGGRDTTSQRAALTIADILIVPFQPRSLDIWTLGKVISLLSEIRAVNEKLEAFAVVNRADAQGEDNREALRIIDEAEGIKSINSAIGQRKAFSNAAAAGLGVSEMKVIDKKALEELRLVYSAVFNAVNMPSPKRQNSGVLVS